MNYPIDLYADWNMMDDSGLPWSLVDEAAHPARIRPGAFIVAGHGTAIAVAEVVDVVDGGVAHLRVLPGPISANAHLLNE